MVILGIRLVYFTSDRTLPMYCGINLPTVEVIGPEGPETGFTSADFHCVCRHLSHWPKLV